MSFVSTMLHNYRDSHSGNTVLKKKHNLFQRVSALSTAQQLPDLMACLLPLQLTKNRESSNVACNITCSENTAVQNKYKPSELPALSISQRLTTKAA